MDLSSRLSKSAEQIKRDISLSQKAELGQLLSTPGVLSGSIPPAKLSSEYLKSSTGWVYACVGVIADEIAKAKIRLFRMSKEDPIEVVNHPALELLYKANVFTTKFDLFWLTAQYLEITGEAPWFLAYKGAKPDQIMLLRPDMISVKPGTDEVIGGYTYRVGGRDIPLETKEVVFLRYPDPDRQFRGKGPLQAAARTVDIDEYSEDYNRNFFFNSARPDGVLSTEQKLGKEQLVTVEKRLNQKYRGGGNAHKMMILEKGLKYQPMALTQKDMDFMEQQKFARDKILGIFRVPRTVIGITDDVNRANAEATDYVFAKRTIEPKLRRIEQQLNEFLLPLFAGTEQMFFEFDSPVPEDLIAKRELQQSALAAGWLTINEVRALDGYEGIGPDGDVVRIPLSMIPAGEEGIATEGLKPDSSKSLDVRRQAKKRQAETIVKEKIKSLEQIIFKVAKQRLMAKKALKQKHKDETPVIPDDPKAMAFQDKQLSVADDFEKRYIQGVMKVLAEEQAVVLKRMPAKSMKAADDWKDWLLVPAQEKKRFAVALSKLVSELIIAQSTEAFNFLGVEGGLTAVSPAVLRFVESRAFKFVPRTTKLTNKLLSKQFSVGIASGEGIPQLRKRVGNVFDDMEKYRAERIARTETIKASNYGAVESYKESGIVTSKRWLTTPDERTCEWCGPMNGKTLGLDDSYFEKGDVFAGNRGGVIKLNYENVGEPPLHSNCRCTVVPVVTDGRGMKGPGGRTGDEEKTDDLDEILNDLDDEQTGANKTKNPTA